jgi:glycosyltransferase involved in cell wall biosynthesis
VIRIAYDHQFFSTFRYSGVTRYFYEIVSRLINEQDVSLSLYMGFHINEFDFARFKNRYAHFFGYRRPVIPKTARLFNTINDSLFPLFIKRAGPDIYHQTYYRLHLPGFRGKRVLTVYDMTGELFPDMFSRTDPVILEKQASIRQADAIIAISESTKNDIIRLLSIPTEKITVVYLANSLTALPGSRSPHRGPFILYVGQRFLHKNFPVLLNAYCHSSRVNKEYGLVCFGGSPFTKEEEQILAQHGLSGHASHMCGSDDLLATYYSHASLLVYPSLYEGFGLPLLESMHYGCPVVASNSSSLPEVGADACIYFDPTSTADLTDKMERALFDDSLRGIMIERGHAREKQFSWDRAARETLQVYKRIM